MRCEFCQGTGYTMTSSSAHERPTPCHECNAYGVQHCCEGLREQPEADDADLSDRRS